MTTLKAMIDAEIKKMEQMEEYIEVLPEGADEDGNQ